MENPNYYSIIPADVRYDKRLKPNAKLLYAEISSLTNKKGYCFATNKYFADLYGVSRITVSNWIGQLIKFGYIDSIIKYKENSKEVENRYISLIERPIKEKINRSKGNDLQGIKETIKTPIKENTKDNSTSINTINIIKGNEEFLEICSFYLDNDFIEIWKEFEEVRKKKKASKTERAYKTLLKNLIKFSNGNKEIAIKIVENSANSGWSNLYEIKGNKQSNYNGNKEAIGKRSWS